MTAIIKGISVPFTFDNTGYPAPVVDERALSDSIFTILSTSFGERVFRPDFGSDLRRLVMGNLTTALGLRARYEVRRAIEEWEPRVRVTNISFRADQINATLEIDIEWKASGLESATRVELPTGGL